MAIFIKSILNKFSFQLNRYSLSESRKLTCILAASMFICMLLYTLQRSYNSFVYDAAYYWSLAHSFIANDSFSFINFHSDLRGYFFPFMLFVLRTLADFLSVDDKKLFYIFSSMFFTTLSVYILPWFINTVFGWKQHLSGRALIGILIFFFWRGHFLYPLSDFPALAFVLLGTTFLLYSLRNPPKYILPALAGFFLSAAINIRPIYLVLFLILLISGIVVIWRSRETNIFLWLTLFMLGCSIVLIPQFQINSKNYYKNSPLVQARYADENSYVKALFWGLKNQKSEGNIGENYTSGVVNYRDPIGLKIQKTKLLQKKDLSSYIRIARQFPTDLAVSYFRHLFNGLDIFFPTPYIKNIFASHMYLSITNYLIWLLIIFHLVNMNLSRVSFLTTTIVIGLLSPAILSIPTQIEIRYFLPAHILAYAVIAFGLDLKRLTNSIFQNKRNFLRTMIVCILWLGLCITLSAATVENLTV